MKNILLIIICISSVSLSAQDYKIGMYLGPNFSFLSVKSDYSYYWSDQYKPGFGFEIGGFGSLKVSEKLSFDHTLAFQFLTHKDKNEIHLNDADGYNYYNIDKHTINNGYIVLSPQLSYHINQKLYLGTGVNINFKVYSLSFFKESENFTYSERSKSSYKNTYYKSINISVPIVVGYNIDKFFMRLKFDVGISNLMKDSNSFFKENEHTLSLNFGYFFVSE